MSPSPPSSPPDRGSRALIVMRRVRGRWRVVRRPAPPEFDGAPLWIRIGFMIPLETLPFLALVACLLALVGGGGLWLIWTRLA